MNCFSVLGKSLFFPQANKIGHFSIFSVPLSGHLTNDHGIEGHRSLPVMTSQTASYSKEFSLWPCVMVKAAKYEIQKPSTWRATLFLASLGRCLPFFTFHDQLVAQQKHLLRVEESRARIYSEQQILALLLVFHQSHNLSRIKCARVLANQPISALHFFNPQQMFFLRVKLITQGQWKTRNIDQNLQRNNVARQVEGFCISSFAALMWATTERRDLRVIP